MRRFKQTLILCVLSIIIIFMINQYVLATNVGVTKKQLLHQVPFSQDFENWLALSETERAHIIQPKMYDELNTPFVINNPFYTINLLSASMSSRYSLKDVIASNVTIRNQYDTNTCWAFAGLSSLETNLALNNYYANENLDKVYDFSERHANYATTREFLNDEVNEWGFNRDPALGGQWFLIETYLTNGQGAIPETEMPFENNSDRIPLSTIENKTVETQVYDTIYFDNYNELDEAERTEEMNKIKHHIQNYGSVFASIHGATLSTDDNCYNNDTGAKYCNNATSHMVDHAVSIIGWDDDYSIDHFNETLRPSSPGAWIVRNSWGENLEYDLVEFKEELFSFYTNDCISMGWYSASEIPDAFIESIGYIISGDKILIPIGDNGYMYISYEDCNVGTTLYGIVKATDEVNYDYIYQYDELYPAIEITLEESSTYLCNIFEKQSLEKEYLTGVALTAPETYTCKVYVNPNGSEKEKSNLQFVPLKGGDSITIDKGYHTLEFANPIEITANQFAVIVEIQGTREQIAFQIEGKIDGFEMFDDVTVEKEKCFVASMASFDTCTWFDLSTLEDIDSGLTNGDSSLKAFTTTTIKEKILSKIEIVTPPTKTTYQEGENFDKTGMVVQAVYNDSTTLQLSDSDYSITNGTNLRYGQESVTITYMEKNVEQVITVLKKEEPKESEPQKPEENEPEQQHEQQPEQKTEPKPQESTPKEQEKPENTDFTKAKFILTRAVIYTYDESSKNHYILDAEINGITRNLKNDSYEYYYSFSSNANLKNFTNWVKIEEKQTNEDKLVFQIDSRKITDFEDEISNSEKIYIYIKEVVVKSGNQGVSVSKAIQYEKSVKDAEIYYNDVEFKTLTMEALQGDSNYYTSGEYQDEQAQTEASPNKLPYTGNHWVVIGIILFIIVGIILFIRYEILNHYIS